MKVKNVVIFVLIIVLAVLLKTFVFYDRYKMPKGAEIEIAEKEIDVYEEDEKLYNLIESSNVEILTDDLALDTTTIGEHTVTIDYKYKGIKKYKYDVKYNVIDEIAPIFISSPIASRSFFVGEASQEDLDKIINKATYADNYDIYPKLEIEGTVDFETLGTYEITATLSDSSNNKTVKKVDITIKERPVVTNTSEKTEENEEEEDKRIPFEEQIINYKTDKTMVGIDISKWQGEVDFDKIKEAGCEFVIIRIGVMKDKDSELVKDKTFDTNYKNAKTAGLKVGIYVYSEANNVNTAISNAEFIIKELGGDKLDFPVVFDWESWTYFNSMEMNLHMLNEMYEAFRDTLKESGYDAMIYASEYYLNNAWMNLKDYKLWVAKYSTKVPEITNGNNKYILWQNSNTGKINGVDGEVDLDIYYK